MEDIYDDAMEEVDGFVDGELTGVDGVLDVAPAEVHGVVDGALTVVDGVVVGPVAKLDGVDGDAGVDRTGAESRMGNGPCGDEFCTADDAKEFTSGAECVEHG